MKTKHLFVVGWLSFASVASAQDAAKSSSAPLDPQGVMKKAQAAMNQVNTVEYRLVQRGIDDGPDTPPKIEGRVVLSGYLTSMWVDKFRLDAKIRRPGESEPARLVAGSDGDVIYLVDEKEKKVHADIDPAVLGSNTFTILETVISNFVNPDPFEYERKAEKIELKEPVNVGDEECHVLRFQLGGGNNEIVWFVSKRDWLPRRFDWKFQGPDGTTMGSSTVLTELRVNPKLDGNPYKFTVPEGFAKTSDFAP